MSDNPVTAQSPREVIHNEWANRLESGRYRRGHGYLRRATEDGDEYCCLGVLCEIAVEAGIVIRRGSSRGTSAYGRVDGLTTNSCLPEAVAEWAQVTRMGELRVMDPEVGGSLVYLNDGAMWSFEKIAQVIRDDNLKRESS